MKHILASVMIFLGGASLPATGQSFIDGLVAYYTGEYIAAYEILKPLAEQGDADAQNSIGNMYDNGQGVLQDHAEAAKWYRLAAEQGSALAQSNLGVMYRQGRGVLQDYARAHMWANIAAANGYDALLRDAYAENMTSAQIAEAQRLARICLASDYQDCD